MTGPEPFTVTVTAANDQDIGRQKAAYGGAWNVRVVLPFQAPSSRDSEALQVNVSILVAS